MSNRWFEALIGFVVIVICLSFSYRIYTVTSGNISTNLDVNTYTARFSNIEGITMGSDVKIGGVKVGSVVDIYFTKDLMVEMKITARSNVKIPSDSQVVITSSGLLGGKYIEIKPGIEEEYLQDNGSFQFSQSVVSLEGIISRFAFK